MVGTVRPGRGNRREKAHPRQGIADISQRRTDHRFLVALIEPAFPLGSGFVSGLLFGAFRGSLPGFRFALRGRLCLSRRLFLRFAEQSHLQNP